MFCTAIYVLYVCIVLYVLLFTHTNFQPPPFKQPRSSPILVYFFQQENLIQSNRICLKPIPNRKQPKSVQHKRVFRFKSSSFLTVHHWYLMKIMSSKRDTRKKRKSFRIFQRCIYKICQISVKYWLKTVEYSCKNSFNKVVKHSVLNTRLILINQF